MNQKTLFTLSIILLGFTMQAQSIIGQWETYDDKTNEKKAIIEIYKQDDTYGAKIIKNFVRNKDAVCDKCEGENKNKPIIGLVIIENIKKNNEAYEEGTILDPESGDVYKCYLKLIEENKLKVRGYIGFSLIGRTQYWLRKK
tara:strand:- start:10543 stop:10968 length:426 start_codon:yes stop_codon:yes gene_type:complete